MRLERLKGKAKVIQKYKKKAQSRMLFAAAAKTWANGVPWEESLKIAERMTSRVAKGQGKGVGKGKGFPRRKGSGKVA